MHHEERFCEIILTLGQLFRRRCRLKDFLSRALAVLLFSRAEPFFAILKEGIMGYIDVKLYGIWSSGSEGDVVQRHFLSGVMAALLFDRV